jgi:tetratricopeptide (TPR) repeat protein
VIIYSTECLRCIITHTKNNEGEEVKNKMSQILFLRGYALYKHREFHLSLRDYDDSIALGFHKPAIYYCRMFNYIKLRRVDLAYEDAKNMQDSQFNKRFPSAKLGEYCFRNGLYSDAKRFFLLSHNRKNKLVAMKRLFEIEYRLTNYTIALEYWKKLMENLGANDPALQLSYQKHFRKIVKKCYREVGIQQYIAGNVGSAVRHFCGAILVDLKQFNTECYMNELLSRLVKTNIYKVAKQQRKQVSITVSVEQMAKSYYYLIWSILFKHLDQHSDEDKWPDCLKTKSCDAYHQKYFSRAVKINPQLKKKSTRNQIPLLISDKDSL